MAPSTRRTFIASLTVAAAGAALAAPKKTPKHLAILILDGIGPLAPPQARYALQRGHSVTVFARGARDSDLPAKVEYLEGSRNGDYAQLNGRKFDVVIDNASASQPRWVRSVAPHISSARHYIFLSDEIGEAEEEVEETFPLNATIIRAGTLAGPGDKTDRFTYWPVRIASGGEVLAPGAPADRAAFIDLRDLAEWMIRIAETRTLGTFDAVSPLHMGELLDGIRAATNSNATFTWVPRAFLEKNNVKLPVASTAGFDPAAAIAKGLTFRPLTETVEATIAWHLSRDVIRQAALRAGIDRQREAAVLASWKKETAQ